MIREMVRYGIVKAGTNVFYSGGTTRATTDEKITLKMLRKASGRCRRITPRRSQAFCRPSISAPCRWESAIWFSSTPTLKQTFGIHRIRPCPSTAAQGRNENEIGSAENLFHHPPELYPYTDPGASRVDLACILPKRRSIVHLRSSSAARMWGTSCSAR